MPWLLAPCLAGAQAPPALPFPQHVSYAADSLRPSHRDQAQQDQDVADLYAAWKSHYLAAAGTTSQGHPRFRVRRSRAAGAATVSEGQGYGMIITVLMAGHDPDARVIFDGLWTFSLDHPSEIDPRLSDWWVEADEIPEASGNDSAFDGDADIAYALLMASRQWGDGGRFDYTLEASRVLAGLMESAVGPTSRLPLLGDWVDPGGPVYSEYTHRPSDFAPDHLAAFATVRGSSDWLEVLTAVHDTTSFLQDSYAPATGLVPDFVAPASGSDPTPTPAPPGFLEGPFDGDYYYNSTRVPLRAGVAALVGEDAAARLVAQRISAWAAASAGGDPVALAAGYTLSGAPLPGSNYLTTAFAAPLGVAAMTTPGQQLWLNALYEVTRSSDEDYYEDSLSLLCLIVMSGNYWSPADGGPIPVPTAGPVPLALLSLLLLLTGGRAISRSAASGARRAELDHGSRRLAR